MITVLTALVGSKYGKYGLEILIVAMLVLGAYKWAENHGRTAQRESDAQQQETEIEKSRKEAQAATAVMLKQAADAAAAADARAQAAQQQFAVLASTLQQLAGRQQAAQQQIASLNDLQLHGDVVSKLGLRSPGESAACYLPQEERAIDNAITQWPLCRDQAKTLGDQVTAAEADAKAGRDKADALNETVSAQKSYIAQLEQDYKKLWELHPPKFRAWKCLGLWKCGKSKVDLAPSAQKQRQSAP